MRSYFVFWQGEKFLDLGGTQVPTVVFADHDPGPVSLGGFSNAFTKKYIPVPNREQMLAYLNNTVVYAHPADPLIIQYGLSLVNFVGGGRDTREELDSVDAFPPTKRHHWTRDVFW